MMTNASDSNRSPEAMRSRPSSVEPQVSPHRFIPSHRRCPPESTAGETPSHPFRVCCESTTQTCDFIFIFVFIITFFGYQTTMLYIPKMLHRQIGRQRDVSQELQIWVWVLLPVRRCLRTKGLHEKISRVTTATSRPRRRRHVQKMILNSVDEEASDLPSTRD